MKDSTMGMYQGYTIEGSADLKVTPENNNYTSAVGCNSLPGMVCPPVYVHVNQFMSAQRKGYVIDIFAMKYLILNLVILE